MITKQPRYIEKIRPTVQTGTLSPFIFNTNLDKVQKNITSIDKEPKYIQTTTWRGLL
jgi:hypothetical protein